LSTRLQGSGSAASAGTARRPAQAVDRALTLLEALAADPNIHAHTLTALARNLGVSKSTAHRLLSALMTHDFVAQDSITKRYRLSWGLYRLAHRVPDRSSIHAAARPLMEKAGLELQETINLGYRDGLQVIIVESWSSRQGLTIETTKGVREPLHGTSLGKSLLIDFDRDDLLKLFGDRPLPRFSPKTLTTVDELVTDIALSRSRGYTLDDEEYFAGIRCVGAPVRDHTGSVVAAVSISGPAQRLAGEGFNLATRRLGRLALDISHELGFDGSSVFSKAI
jgi:DNA-binding IclR family transcriptional regulator